MAWKTDIPQSFESHFSVQALLRQFAGFALGVVAVLVFVSLFGLARGEQWIGPAGEIAAQGLNFLFGAYSPFLLPFLIGAAGLSLMIGRDESVRPGRLAFKWSGALLILLAASGAISLFLMLQPEIDEVAVFHAGGFLGCFMIDPAGLNITSLLGSTGAMVLLAGMALTGGLFFAEFPARRLRRMRLAGFGRKAEAADDFNYMPPPASSEEAGASRTGSLVVRPLAMIVRGVGSLLRIPRYASYREGGSGRVLSAPAPVMRLRPAAAAALDPPPNYKPQPDYDNWGIDDDGPIDVSLEMPGEMPAAARKRAKVMPVQSEPQPVAPPRRKVQEPVPPSKAPEFSFPTEYRLPEMSLLSPPPVVTHKMSEEELREISDRIVETLARFRIEVEVIDVVQGPTVTLFALRMAPGIPVKRIFSYESDLTLALCAQQIRILVPIPGQAAIGIEVPNKVTNPIMLRELMESESFQRNKSPLAFALGKNIYGDPVIGDLAQMPHLLIAGSTGAGKSVCLNTIIASMLFRNPPEKIKFIMIDPKMVELSVYDAIPHLLAPVVCDPRKAAAALDWVVEQMQKRYDLLADIGVRNIDSYNAIVTSREPNVKAFGRELKYMPHIVVIVDELADLMVTNGKEVDTHIMRLAAKARASGIHMILATQRPSTDVITGVIKNNFPSRIAFRVTSKFDSMTILDTKGAESLLGKGDMLYAPGGGKASRIQGAYIKEEEIERLADYVRKQEKARYEKEDFDTNPAAQRAKAQLLNNVLGGLAPAPLPPPPMVEEEGEAEVVEIEELAAPRSEPGMQSSFLSLSAAQMESMTDEDLYEVALRLVLETRKASVSNIQRWLKIGYARAGRVMDMMEQRRVVGPSKGSKPRDILVDPETYLRGEEAEDL